MGDIGTIKGGGLAWLLRQEGGSSSKYSITGAPTTVLRSTEEEEGEETVNTCKHKHNKTISGGRGVLTQCQEILAKGETSGKVFLMLGIFGQTNRRGNVACLLCQGHVTNERRAYPDSSHHSEQLSCRKHFHLSYGLFILIFQRFIQFLGFSLTQKWTYCASMTSC